VRTFLPFCVFDDEHCSEGIIGLESYRHEWDEKSGSWGSNPLHNEASHPADAFQQLAMFHELASELHYMVGRQKGLSSGKVFSTVHEIQQQEPMTNSAGQVITDIGFNSRFLDKRRESYTVDDLSEDPYRNA
jgi:hypothetical protein